MTARTLARRPPAANRRFRREPLRLPGAAAHRFGRVLGERRAGAFLVRESRYPASLAMPPHYHVAPYLAFVVCGSIRERGGHGERRYGTGTLHFHPLGDPHEGVTGAEGTTCLSIVLGEGLALRLGARPGPPPDDVDAGALARLARRCRAELARDDGAADLAMESAALELVATWIRVRSRRESGAPRWLGLVRDALHARARSGGSPGLAALSALAGVHPVHLVRAFRQRFGVPPGAYLRALRVERAREALAAGDAPIADVALDAGFSSQAHFTRVFRALTGATPAAWRRARRRD